MGREELAHITAAILVVFVILGLASAIAGNVEGLSIAIISSIILVSIHTLTKKGAAYLLDSGVEHRIWHSYQYWFAAHWHFKKPRPTGIILPLFASIFSLGILKLMPVLTYETKALKHRAAKRHGYYSFTEMTDWDNGLIGAESIIILLLATVIGYVFGYETFAAASAYYTLAQMIPISNLDGTQIFFGSKIIWIVLAAISLVFAFFGFIITIA